MDIFKPGSIVKIRTPSGDPLSGLVTQVCISGEALRITYEVGWWDKRIYCTKWFDSGAIAQTHEDKEPIGFNHGTAEEKD